MLPVRSRWFAPTAGLVAALLVVLGATSVWPQTQDEKSQGKKARGAVEIWISIGPETQDRMVQNKKARVNALLAEVENKVDAIDKIKYGPCLCGAPSHDECYKEGACEKEEEETMAALAAEGKQAQVELVEVAALAKELENTDEPIAVVAKHRAGELRKENDGMAGLRSKLQGELDKVRTRSPEGLRLRLASMEVLSIVKVVTDDIIDDLPDDQKATVKALNDAVVAAIEAMWTGDEQKKLEAVARTLTLARYSLQHLPDLDAKTVEALKITNQVCDFATSVNEAYQEWDRGHDVYRLKVRMAGLIDQAADIAENVPSWKLGVQVFSRSRDAASYAILAWHVADTARAVKLNFDMNRDAQVLLLKKIHHLNSHIDYNEREIDKYEKLSAAN